MRPKKLIFFCTKIIQFTHQLSSGLAKIGCLSELTFARRMFHSVLLLDR
jgi:hypothetical protein